jgi:hypothetical protein
MGEVWRAHDERLQREIALKVLPAETLADPTARARLLREARLASQLNHPNVCTVHEVGETDGRAYIAMELVEGRPLASLIADGGLPSEQVLKIGQQLADALAHAHERGVVHRDLKSGNVIVTPEGRVKVLDFGLAKRLAEGDLAEATTLTQASLTQAGAIVGTLAYMAPEQLRGEGADARSDVWALGVVLHEMAAGARPFKGNTGYDLSSAILKELPPPLPASVPGQLAAVIERCLAKEPARRYQRGGEVCAALRVISAGRAPESRPSDGEPRPRPSRRSAAALLVGLGQPRVIALAAFVVAAAVVVSLWRVHAAKVRWARDEALPRIEELADTNQFFDAWELARAAERAIPGDPALARLWSRISRTVDVTTEPEGADLFINSYAGHENVALGRSPLRGVRDPVDLPRWRIAKAGYETAEGLFALREGDTIRVTLDRTGAAPAGMLRVMGGGFRLDMPHLGPQPEVTLPDYWIDKYEVTNAAYQAFVDAGGYSDPKYWREPFLADDGHEIPRAKAMALFHDRTGRPGPATWEAGTYPDGRADYPVTGVSWYEAAAYAEYAGKSLPTVFHWARAAGVKWVHRVVPESNFSGKGLAPVGRYRGISEAGAYDMAGNAKEWCRNAHGDRRFILGGAWDEPAYQFSGPDALLPLSRPENAGFRLVKLAAPPGDALTRSIDYPRRDYASEQPVGDAAFAVIRGLYAYDKTPLRASVDAVDDTNEHWRKETVSFDAAYAGERVTAYVFLPRHAAPPYQVVVYFPGSGAIDLRSSTDLEPPLDGATVKSGRAFVWPIYKSTFERNDAIDTDYPAETALYREHVFAWYKDLARTLDYIETRPDCDASKVAYYGSSWGARMGPLFLAAEPRLKAGILLVGGLKFAKVSAEVDPFNFAPRVTVPVLMINARNDFYFPHESSQLPLFHLLGSPAGDKRHVILEGSHGRLPLLAVVRESLEWLDRTLGPSTSQHP